jgi:hypothetical protein
LQRHRFYKPTGRGNEGAIRERLKKWWKGKKG